MCPQLYTEHVTLAEFPERNHFFCPGTGAVTTPDLFQQNSENTVYISRTLFSAVHDHNIHLQ